MRGARLQLGSDGRSVQSDSDGHYVIGGLAAGTIRFLISAAGFPATQLIVDIKAGDGIGAMGEVDAAKRTVHALFVAIVDAEQVKKLRESMGKEYIAGKVTAIDEVKLTILRSDNVTQVIEVDETTSFRKGGRRESSPVS